ncbi:g7081 [Coccomyxa viridis]|uniref:G7081 protein n=1 Tax=Coccomyxa viridis TaxID=1274662 RepID=A0ABP1FZB2_9CHLO
MDQQAIRDFVLEYVSELKDLTFNSKSLINTLTMLAGDTPEAASSIAAAIEKHILTCAPNHKLYALYLVDSIAKNIGVPYTTLFAGNMPEVFLNVWLAAPQAQGSLRKVLRTWNGIFPDAVLATVARQIGSPVVSPQQVPYNAAAMPVQMVKASLAAPGPAYLQQPALVPLVPLQGSAGTGQGLIGAQNTILPQSISQYGNSYAQPAVAPSAVASPPGPQQNSMFQPGNPSNSNRQSDGPSSSKSAQAGSRVGGKHLDSLPDISAEELPLKYVDRKKLDFSAERLKAEDPQALRELLACSLALRPKHARLQTCRLLPRSLTSRARPQLRQEVSVPADDSQPVCALSGERFDTFWDDAREEWRYRDAISLTAEQAARYGVQPGTIVKVSCLSDTPASAAAAEEPPAEPEAEVLEQMPGIKEEPAANQPELVDGAMRGVKREAENSVDAEAVVKRIKVEPV